MTRTSPIALLALLLSLGGGAKAQGFLDKMKEKAGASLGLKNTSAKPSKSQLKAAEADSLDGLLDQKAASVAKDKYAINGIWYSNRPIRLRNDLGETGLIGKKFLLEFDEATYRLTLKTRYAYEASNRAKLVRPGLWLSESVPPKVAFAQAIREGHFALPSYGSDNANYLYSTYTGETDLQGKVSRGAVIDASFEGMVELEKGLIVIMKNEYYSTRKMTQEELDRAALHDFVVLFRPEKAQRAYALTHDEVHAFFREYRTRLEKAGKTIDNGEALPRAGKANGSPEFARVIKEAPALMKTALAKHPKLAHFTPLYAYVYPDNPYWNEVKAVRDGRTVSVGRMVGTYVVCANTKPANEDGDLYHGRYAQLKNKYAVFYTGVNEDMKGNAYNTNEFSGKLYITDVGDGPLPISADENVMKYKK